MVIFVRIALFFWFDMVENVTGNVVLQISYTGAKATPFGVIQTQQFVVTATISE